MERHNMFRTACKSVLYGLLGVFCLLNMASGEPVLDKTKFAAIGDNETLLHITTPGRYSIQAHSKQGTAIELVDQMAGPMVSAGIVGQQDGRLDVLLDQGTYKIRLFSHKEGQGDLELAVYPFQEAQPVKKPEDLSLLENLQFVNGTLGDLQQQSFWVYLKQRQIFRLEALGRNLKDCRLWLDGEWLVETVPAISTYEPVAGQPMTYLEFYYDLNPGLYLLTCYGGEALKWAKESKENPFYVRMGVPELGANGQKILTISPFGRDTFIVSGEANFLELSRKDKKQTGLSVSAWNEQGSRYVEAEQAMINKESRDPWCSLQAGNSGGKQVVTVQGTPGDQVGLKYFVIRTRYDFPHRTPNEYWIANQSSSEAADAMDTTAVLFPILPTSPRFVVEKSQVLEIGTDKPLIRKVNLLGALVVFLNVLEDGTYIIAEDPQSGAKGKYQLEPLLFTKPKDYAPSPYLPPGTEMPVTRGFYVLSVTPESQGILAFILQKKELPPTPIPTPQDNNAKVAIAPAASVPSTSFPKVKPPDDKERVSHQRILWPHVRLETSDNYVLLLNSRPEVVSGFIIRPLPLDLSDPLPVTLLPDEQVPIDVEIKKNAKLVVENDQNASFAVSGYVEPISADSVLAPGKYTLTLKNTSAQATLFIVKTIPAEIAPTLTKTELVRKFQGKPQFPVLTENNPFFRDFDREEKQHFTVVVEEPGLYRLETSGRLATSITVRNRFTTNLFSAEQNGIGRNALVQQYLKPGEYQITVQPLGRSKGRAGIYLHRAALVEESGLKVGVPEKVHLVPDEAVRYQFAVEQEGKYQLDTLGLNKTFLYRLEDHDGWPLVAPNQQSPVTYDFTPGSYYYYSLPDGVESRRVTLLEKIEGAKPKLDGKGPHPITFNQPVKHVWREEPDRPPDVFVLDVPDPVKAAVSLSKDLEVGMYQCAADVCDNEIARIRGGKDREFDSLLPGHYEFRVKSIEENDQLPYTLSVQTDWLIPGLRHTVGQLPASFTVSVGKDSLVDIASFGATDVKATLWQGDRLVAYNDDIANDWNFQISQKLPAGTYLLKIEPVGTAVNTENTSNEGDNTGDTETNTEGDATTDTNADTEMNNEGDTATDTNAADTEMNNEGDTETTTADENTEASTAENTEANPETAPEDYRQLAVSMTRRVEVPLASQSFPFTVETELSKDMVSIPFTTPAAEQLTRIHVTGQGVVKLALFQDNRALAEGECELLIPLKAMTQYTLLAWRLDESQGTITLNTQPLPVQEFALSSEKTIIPITAPYVTENIELAAFKLTNAEKISYTLQSNGQTLLFSPDVNVPFTQVQDVPVVMSNRSGWLLWQAQHVSQRKTRYLNQCPSVNLLERPDATSSVMTQVFCGSQVEVIDQKPNETDQKGIWYHIRTEKGEEGWICADEGKSIMQSSPLSGVVVTQTSPLNIRSKPEKQAGAFRQAQKGEQLTIKGGLAEWYYVQLQDGTQGYAASQYITPEPQPEQESATEAQVQYDVTILPFALSEKDQSTVVELRQTPLPFDFAQTTDAPMLFEIKSVGANLGTMIMPQASYQADVFDWESMWMEPSQTLAAIPGQGIYRAKIWSTSDEAVRGKVSIKTRAFAVKGQSDWGDALQLEGTLQPGESEKIRLRDVPQALELLLTDGVIAFVWQKDHTEAIVAATNGNLQQRIGVNGGDLILLNPGVKTALYRVEQRDVTAELVQLLDPVAGFEKVFTNVGKFALKITDGEKPLFVAGEQVKSRFLRDDGRIIEGSAANVPFTRSWFQYPAGTGLLEVFYAPGYVRVWQSKPEDAHQNFIANEPLAFSAIAAQNLQTGSGALENRDQLWTFSIEQPTYMIAETEAPGITAIVSQNRVLTTSAGSQSKGRQLDYFLQPGEYQIWTRPLKGLDQKGVLRLHRMTPYALDTEATAKTWLIRSGETQVFRFEVTTESKVGVGVQTESDKLAAALFDHQFTPIAGGPLMFKDLEAGEYILTVKTTEPNSMPVQYRPVVYGHHGSKQGIPPEVIQEYQ